MPCGIVLSCLVLFLQSCRVRVRVRVRVRFRVRVRVRFRVRVRARVRVRVRVVRLGYGWLLFWAKMTHSPKLIQTPKAFAIGYCCFFLRTLAKKKDVHP